MNLAQIIIALPLQVYIRRGELVIHFSSPTDLVSRLAETSAALAELERQADPSRPDPKAERGARRAGRPAARSEEDSVPGDEVNEAPRLA